MKYFLLLFTLIFLFALTHLFILHIPNNSEAVIESPKGDILIGMATGASALGDKSFYDTQYSALVHIWQDRGVAFVVESAPESSGYSDTFERLIEKGVNIIVASNGIHMKDEVDAMARKYPEVKFIVIDTEAKEYLPNVAAITFRQHEGAYLVGALAAMQTKTNKIAMIGAEPTEVVVEYFMGFEAGAKKINPKIEIILEYINKYDSKVSPYANPIVADVVADALYKRHNVDIIFQVSGGSSSGIFNAAIENKKYVIGSDIDQDYLAPSYILTSLLKRIDIGIETVITKILDGQFENRVYTMGLKDGGIALSEMAFTRDIISQKTLDTIDNLRQQIIEGKIVVPTLLYRINNSRMGTINSVPTL